MKSIIKTITYRFLSSFVTMFIAFFITGDVRMTSAIGFFEIILKSIVYFLHEKIWSIKKCHIQFKKEKK